MPLRVAQPQTQGAQTPPTPSAPARTGGTSNLAIYGLGALIILMIAVYGIITLTKNNSRPIDTADTANYMDGAEEQEVGKESDSVAKEADAASAATDDAAQEEDTAEASVDWTHALDSAELPFWDAIFYLDTFDGKFTLVPASQVGAPSIIWGTLPETELVLSHVTALRCEVENGRTCIWRVDSPFSLPPEKDGGQAVGSNLTFKP